MVETEKEDLLLATFQVSVPPMALMHLKLFINDNPCLLFFINWYRLMMKNGEIAACRTIKRLIASSLLHLIYMILATTCTVIFHKEKGRTDAFVTRPGPNHTFSGERVNTNKNTKRRVPASISGGGPCVFHRSLYEVSAIRQIVIVLLSAY